MTCVLQHYCDTAVHKSSMGCRLLQRRSCDLLNPSVAVAERRGTQIQMNLTCVPRSLSTAAPRYLLWYSSLPGQLPVQSELCPNVSPFIRTHLKSTWRSYQFWGWCLRSGEDPGILKLSEAGHIGAGVDARVIVVISVQQVVRTGRFEGKCDLKWKVAGVKI